jgi:hypothetical protein
VAACSSPVATMGIQFCEGAYVMLHPIALLVLGTALASCSGSGTIADRVPAWAGGLPKDVPPRPGMPEYDAHKERLEGRGKVDAAQQPAKKPNAPN